MFRPYDPKRLKETSYVFAQHCLQRWRFSPAAPEKPTDIQGLADALKPSVSKVLQTPGNLLDNATAQNVRDTVARL